MLSADDVDRLQQFLGASADAQRLLARLLTRAGPYFLRSTLNYAEVSSPDDAVAELHQRGLISVQPGAADRLLKLYTKNALCECFSLAATTRKLTKQQIMMLNLL